MNIIIEKNATIINAKKIHSQLLSICSKNNITLDLSNIEEVDVSFFQLLHTFHLYTLKQNIKFDIICSDFITKKAQNIGFFCNKKCPFHDTNCIVHEKMSE